MKRLALAMTLAAGLFLAIPAHSKDKDKDCEQEGDNEGNNTGCTQQVPEPSGFAMLGSGVVVLGVGCLFLVVRKRLVNSQ